jgi:hypothetical protein
MRDGDRGEEIEILEYADKHVETTLWWPTARFFILSVIKLQEINCATDSLKI